MDLKLNIFNILILMGILQGIVFGFVVLFSKKYSSKANAYLAFTVLSLSFSNLQYWFLDSRLANYFPYISYVRIPCELLILPMFYLFVNAYLEKQVPKKIKQILFIPFFIDLLVELFFTINDFSLHFKIDTLYYYVEEFFSFSFSLFLIIRTFQLILKYEKENSGYHYNKVKAETKWIKQLLLIGFIACLFWIAILFYMKAYNDKRIYYGLWLSISFIVYWISYVGLFQSYLFSERQSLRKELSINKAIASIEPALKRKTNEESNQKLIAEFENLANQMFSNPNLRIEDIAFEMGITRNYLSQVLGTNNIRFNNYINEIRIAKVKVLLKSDAFSQYTITSIGLEAGFNSNASFYRAFKKTTGVSPVFYRKSDL